MTWHASETCTKASSYTWSDVQSVVQRRGCTRHVKTLLTLCKRFIFESRLATYMRPVPCPTLNHLPSLMACSISFFPILPSHIPRKTPPSILNKFNGESNSYKNASTEELYMISKNTHDNSPLVQYEYLLIIDNSPQAMSNTQQGFVVKLGQDRLLDLAISL